MPCTAMAHSTKFEQNQVLKLTASLLPNLFNTQHNCISMVINSPTDTVCTEICLQDEKSQSGRKGLLKMGAGLLPGV